METDSTYFIILIAVNCIALIFVFIWAFLSIKHKRNHESMLVTSIVAILIVGIVFWGLIPYNMDQNEVFIPIPSSKVEVYKTPILYVIEIDKEYQFQITELESCRLFDQKDSLFFYKHKSYNFYGGLNFEKFIWERKPLKLEERLN